MFLSSSEKNLMLIVSHPFYENQLWKKAKKFSWLITVFKSQSAVGLILISMTMLASWCHIFVNDANDRRFWVASPSFSQLSTTSTPKQSSPVHGCAAQAALQKQRYTHTLVFCLLVSSPRWAAVRCHCHWRNYQLFFRLNSEAFILFSLFNSFSLKIPSKHVLRHTKIFCFCLFFHI